MVACKICGHQVSKSLQAHINRTHFLTVEQYSAQFKGAPILSDEYYKEISEKNKKQAENPEWRSKVSEGLKESWKDPEFAKMMSEAMKGCQSTPEAKANHRKGFYKNFDSMTDQEKEDKRQSIVESWKDPEKRNNRVTALRKAHNSGSVRKNHSEATKKFYSDRTDLERQDIKDNLKKVWAIPENREKLKELSKIGLKAANSPEGREAQYKAFEKNPLGAWKSSLNIMMEKALKKEGLNFVSEARVGNFFVDFLFEEKKLIVETDGDYWHANPLVYPDKSKWTFTQNKKSKKDEAQKIYCENRGYKLLRFWETDLKKDLNLCVSKIKEVLAS